MTVGILRLLYSLWALGVLTLFLNAASRAVFGRERLTRKLTRVALSFPLALVWPVSLFSPAGRRVLLKRINQL